MSFENVDGLTDDGCIYYTHGKKLWNTLINLSNFLMGKYHVLIFKCDKNEQLYIH